jgi:hypothetical protein
MNKAGKTDSVTINVNVTPANRKVIYVSNDGSDSNTGLTQNTPVKSFARAAALLEANPSNTEILFKRGDTFTANSSLWISGQNVVLGAYGLGDRPTIKWNGLRNSSVIFASTGSAKNVTVQDLSVDSVFGGDTNDAGTPLAMRPTGSNITMRRVELLNLMYGMNLNQQPKGVLMQDSTAPLERGLRKYLAWVEGENVVIIGNQAANSTREHIVRVNLASKINVSGNDFTNLDPADDVWDYRKPTLNMQSGAFGFAEGNRLDGRLDVGPLGSGQGAEYMERRFKYLILENNDVVNDMVSINHGAEQITLRHNTFEAHGYAAVRVDGYSSEYGRGVVNLVLHDNVGINDGKGGEFFQLNGAAKNIRMIDNAYRAPNLVAGTGTILRYAPSDAGSFVDMTGNVWPTLNAYASRAA